MFPIMHAVNRWTDIPEFADEAAEARFWESRGLDGRLMASFVHERGFARVDDHHPAL